MFSLHIKQSEPSVLKSKGVPLFFVIDALTDNYCIDKLQILCVNFGFEILSVCDGVNWANLNHLHLLPPFR